MGECRKLWRLSHTIVLGASLALAQSSLAADTQLVIQIRSEALLEWQSDDTLLVKARLAPGASARVWSDDACGAVPTGARVIPASGTYSISGATLEGGEKANVCLSSTDGSLNTSLSRPSQK